MADPYASVAALLPATVAVGASSVSPKKYDTALRLPGTETRPGAEYFIVNVGTPAPAGRSEGDSTLGHSRRVRLTCVARTGGVVDAMTRAAETALDRVTVTPDGFGPGVLRLRNARPPQEDPDVTFTNGATAIYAVLEFELTASRLS